MKVKTEWHLFLLAVQFLTRVPVPNDVPYSDDLSVRSAKYYPLVGICVGATGGVVLWMSSTVLPIVAAVVLSVIATLLITGAMHEDGLADAADGLFGAPTKDRALEIMRDSRVGSYGVLALGAVIALKVTLLASLEVAAAAALLVVGHAIGRMATVHTIATTDYARPEGTKFVAPTVTRDGYRVALAITVASMIAMTLVFGPVVTVSGVVFSIALAQWFRTICVRKLGGYTGDCLGATQQLSELGLYLGAVIWL